MAYIETNWKSGDVVSSVRLNKMEKGIRDNSLGFENLITEDMIDAMMDISTQNVVGNGEVGQMIL